MFVLGTLIGKKGTIAPRSIHPYSSTDQATTVVGSMMMRILEIKDGQFKVDEGGSCASLAHATTHKCHLRCAYCTISAICVACCTQHHQFKILIYMSSTCHWSDHFNLRYKQLNRYILLLELYFIFCSLLGLDPTWLVPISSLISLMRLWRI